jgi:FKBP-type peptidyl-prolyl cis-trans isomerase
VNAARTLAAFALGALLALAGGALAQTAPLKGRLLDRVQDKAARDKAAGAAYLAQKAQEAGAEVAASGLIYKRLRAGSGPSPSAASTVKVEYEGRLIDGTVFDSSRKRGEPAVFPLGRVIKCWTEGVARMQVGEVAQLVCPSNIAYGDRGQPGLIPGGAVLTFEVELLAIEDVNGRPDPVVAAARQKALAKAVLEAEAKEPGAEVLPSGVIYRETKAGAGAHPSPTGSVTVHYEGLLSDGAVFDSTHKRGAPLSLPLPAVIPCWREAMPKMAVGGTARLTCPSNTAYGDLGQPPSVPPGATLRFDVELVAAGND